jgi:putative oxidoreductase
LILPLGFQSFWKPACLANSALIETNQGTKILATDTLSATGGLMGIVNRIERIVTSFVPVSLASFAARIALAVPFYKSGLTKWDGFLQLSDTPPLLFAEEFKLHLFGYAFDYPFPTLMAWGSSIGEIVLPILLVLGLFTRFAAVGLLLMTALIQLTIPDGWANFHLPWAALALAIIHIGPGKIAFDNFLRR